MLQFINNSTSKSKNKPLKINAAVAGMIAHAASGDLFCGRIQEVEKHLASVRCYLTPDVSAPAKVRLLLAGAECAHILGLIDEADRYLRQLAAVPAHLPEDQLAISQRLHARVHLDRQHYDLAGEVLCEIDRDVLVLSGHQG
ncbi:MAG: hypothetical protein ACREDR_36125, partial [Blastocatellia bacterium]